MGMRLLKKSEVTTLKAKEKDSEIKQGVQLAKRVDALREVQAAEEASLEAFRRTTIANIHQEIKAETAELEAIRGEWAELQKKLVTGMSEVEGRLAEVEDREAYADALITTCNERLAQIRADEAIVAQKLAEAQHDEQRIAYDKQRTTEALIQADQARQQANLLLNEAETKTARVAELETNSEATLRKQHQYLNERAEVIAERENRVAKQESELNDRERQINDRYHALLQAEEYVASKKA